MASRQCWCKTDRIACQPTYRQHLKCSRPSRQIPRNWNCPSTDENHKLNPPKCTVIDYLQGPVQGLFQSLHMINLKEVSHTFHLAETKILSHSSNWTARVFKTAWLSSKHSTNKCIQLLHAYLALRTAIEEKPTLYLLFL